MYIFRGAPPAPVDLLKHPSNNEISDWAKERLEAFTTIMVRCFGGSTASDDVSMPTIIWVIRAILARCEDLAGQTAIIGKSDLDRHQEEIGKAFVRLRHHLGLTERQISGFSSELKHTASDINELFGAGRSFWPLRQTVRDGYNVTKFPIGHLITQPTPVFPGQGIEAQFLGDGGVLHSVFKDPARRKHLLTNNTKIKKQEGCVAVLGIIASSW